MTSDQVIRWYQTPALSTHKTAQTLHRLQSVCSLIQDLESEHCIYVQIRGKKSLITIQISAFSRNLIKQTKVKSICLKCIFKNLLKIFIKFDYEINLYKALHRLGFAMGTDY